MLLHSSTEDVIIYIADQLCTMTNAGRCCVLNLGHTRDGDDVIGRVTLRVTGVCYSGSDIRVFSLQILLIRKLLTN